jgi:hypothetical protein
VRGGGFSEHPHFGIGNACADVLQKIPPKAKFADGLFQFLLKTKLVVGVGHARDKKVRGHGPLLSPEN